MGKKSKVKGSKFELAVAKAFGEWTGDEVRRTPGSGGWNRKGGFDVAGDLVFTEVNTIHIECKCAEGWKLEHLLSFKGMEFLPAWWDQCVRECPAGKTPLLVFSKNFAPTFVVYRYGVLVGDDPENIGLRPGSKSAGARFEAVKTAFGESVIIQELEVFFARFELKRRKQEG